MFNAISVVAGVLNSGSVTASSTARGAVAVVYTFSATLSNAVPSTGAVILKFSPEFYLTSKPVPACSGISGIVGDDIL